MTPRLADYIALGKDLSPDEREMAALALLEINNAEQAEVDSLLGAANLMREGARRARLERQRKSFDELRELEDQLDR
ncbi:MAG: hypothetical protein LBE08_13325 [Bifidobacteriaceae bacterium]|nr:hypothetical protein [Bifidobacteriaceae bacterium]